MFYCCHQWNVPPIKCGCDSNYPSVSVFDWYHRSNVNMIQNTPSHYDDVIMGTIASLITSLTIVYSTVYPDADQRKHQSSPSLAFVCGIHRGPVNSPHKWPVMRKMFPFDDVIMVSVWLKPPIKCEYASNHLHGFVLDWHHHLRVSDWKVSSSVCVLLLPPINQMCHQLNVNVIQNTLPCLRLIGTTNQMWMWCKVPHCVSVWLVPPIRCKCAPKFHQTFSTETVARTWRPMKVMNRQIKILLSNTSQWTAIYQLAT